MALILWLESQIEFLMGVHMVANLPYCWNRYQTEGVSREDEMNGSRMVNRRMFLQTAALGLFNLKLRASSSLLDSATPTLCYMDGYHGGIKGHMPDGSWRDILNALIRFPEWKLSLDIEPSSWEVLRREDPQAFTELGHYLADQSRDRRVEMVGGTFAQPYGWAVCGESNIRQMQRGLQVIHQQYPSAAVMTYAVQEPCWASCLPQILKSLRFDGAVLRDASTAWGGYSSGFDADLVNWIGPDGTAITTVPRYAVENLQKVYETESIDGTAEFARKCVAHGIPHPAGMSFQDLGWPAKPRVNEPFARFATWQQYIHEIADKPTKDWHFGIEDILVTLPWGNPTLQTVAQEVRAAENRLIVAEKVAAIAFMETAAPWPEQQLQEAWDHLLLCQAHDAWITATTRQGRNAWAFRVASDTLSAEESADQIIGEASDALARGGNQELQTPLGDQWVRVVNTLAVERSDIAEISLATDPGTTGVTVTDASGAIIPSQITITRSYLTRNLLNQSGGPPLGSLNEHGKAADTDGINNAIVSFSAKVPSIGFADYRLTPLCKAPSEVTNGKVSVTTAEDGTILMESDLYRLKVDLQKGGAITSLFAKEPGYEFCNAESSHLFNEYRGYFISQLSWRSSAESVAQVKIVESGPMRATVEIRGNIGGVPCQTTVSISEGQRRIDFKVRFTYEQDTWIGDPWDIKPEDRNREQRRSQNDGRWKLQALFPVSFAGKAIYKNAAFDVCKSRNDDTFFQRWDEIKHNIVLNWVSVADTEDRFGIAVISDHTTAYTHGPDHPLSLVLGWAWEGGFWWGKHPLRGEQTIRYGIVPYTGRWDRAGISQENSKFCEPPVSFLIGGRAKQPVPPVSLVKVSDPGVEISAMYIKDGALIVRLFNAESDESEHAVSFERRPHNVHVVELDGVEKQNLPISSSETGRFGVRINVPRFGLVTLRCEWVNMRWPA
jgi:alpha-mannosidase